MNYIVLDLEFNQPFPFKTGEQTELNPECPFEIIQIGAVKLNDAFEIIDSFNAMIKPQIYPRIHPYVEKITGITEEQLKNGETFPNAYSNFLDFLGDGKNILCTWGIDDIKSLYKNILFYNLDISRIPEQYSNVQTYASSYLQYEAGKSIGLKNAVTELNLEINSSFHNALHDAEYTAQIFRIVKPEKLVPDTFEPLDLAPKKYKNARIHIKNLLAHFETSLNRELTPEEKNLVKSAYKLGRNHTFDILPEKK
jgi:inhibitor of KinA sporulation pathway (predicted exonuclease)